MGQVCQDPVNRPMSEPSTAVDVDALRRELEHDLEGEVRFDRSRGRCTPPTPASTRSSRSASSFPSRATMSSHGAAFAGSGCPLTMRGGGTSQAGQAIGGGVIVDISKYLNRLLEVNAAERCARVEPGIVLDELNASLRPQVALPPDISTASRATIGGMIANNSAGTRSVVYGKTIDHVSNSRWCCRTARS